MNTKRTSVVKSNPGPVSTFAHGTFSARYLIVIGVSSITAEWSAVVSFVSDILGTARDGTWESRPVVQT
jgi:hypothetical protein